MSLELQGKVTCTERTVASRMCWRPAVSTSQERARMARIVSPQKRAYIGSSLPARQPATVPMTATVQCLPLTARLISV